MKMVSTLALAAALTLGLAATPAMAQKKKDDSAQEAPKLNVSEAFRKPAAAADAALKAQDWATAETQIAAAEAVAKNDDEKYYAAYMRLSIELHKQSHPGIIQAADALIASPRTSPAGLAEYYYLRGQATFLDNKRPESIPFLLKARELGYVERQATYMIAQAYFDAGKNQDGLNELGKAIDEQKVKGLKPDEALYNYAVSRVYKTGDRATTAVWLMRETRDFPTLANWRRVIVLYREMVDKSGTPLDRTQKIDLFRLMRFTGGLAGQGDYLDYSTTALSAALPWEAVASIDEGRKAGVVPKTDTEFDRVYSLSKTAITNEGSLDKTAAAAATAKDFLGTGDAFLSAGNYARALEMYDKAAAKGGVNADEVNLNRGVALVQLGRKDEARQVFASVHAAPLADIAKFWVTWMDLPPLT